jgi:hypothetical protein
MEVSGQFHAPAALLPGKEPLIPVGHVLDAVVKRKIPNTYPPPQESNPRIPIVQPVAQRYEVIY